MIDSTPGNLSTFFGVLDALYCVTIVLDRVANVRHVNRQFELLTGLSRQQIVGQSAFLLCADDQERQQLAGVVRRFFESTREERFTLPSAAGGRFAVAGSAGALDLSGMQEVSASQIDTLIQPHPDFRIITCIDISRLEATRQSMQKQYEFVVNMSNTVLDQALELRDNNQLLEGRVRERTADLHIANLDAIYMLAEAAEAKDHDTAQHVRRVQKLARAIALTIGFSETEADQIGYSSILHDVGKLRVPDHILNKPGPLDDDEQLIMRQHTLVAERIIVDKPFFSVARLIARHHHENFDGSGYPDGLAGDAIPVEARLVHIADVYDALTSTRIYKPAWPRDYALAEITEGAGEMFDPNIAKALEAAVLEAERSAQNP